jgi:hypothetical protein
LSEIHHLNGSSPYPDDSLIPEGDLMLAISTMSPTATSIFFIVGFVLFILGGVGVKPAGDRVHLLSLGLAAYIFVLAWNALALT